MDVDYKQHEDYIDTLATPVGYPIANYRERPGLAFTPPIQLCAIRECVLQTNELCGSRCEIGVARGGSAFVIADAMRRGTLHLLDSGLGLPELVEKDRVTLESSERVGTFYIHEGDFAYDGGLFLDESIFDDMPITVNFHKGWVSETILDIADDQFSFIYADCDVYEATRDILATLYPRLVSGGIISFDDVYSANTPGVKIALEEYFDDIGSLDSFQLGSSLTIRKQ